jgi:hypothetical protein
MIATAFIQSGKTGQPTAPGYYRIFPEEPIPAPSTQQVRVDAEFPSHLALRSSRLRRQPHCFSLVLV